MNQKTRTIAIQLLAAMARDPDASIEMETYGNWVEHLEDQLTDTEDD
ncbi:hypothetical protein OAA10_00290 [bacterium]|nr:hypothetical protein [bacterium]